MTTNNPTHATAYTAEKRQRINDIYAQLKAGNITMTQAFELRQRFIRSPHAQTQHQPDPGRSRPLF